MAILVTIEPDSTRDDLLEALANYNASAMQVSRRGWAAMQSDHYRDLHDTVSFLTEAILMFDSIPA